jgi:hypothetical protein
MIAKKKRPDATSIRQDDRLAPKRTLAIGGFGAHSSRAARPSLTDFATMIRGQQHSRTSDAQIEKLARAAGPITDEDDVK